MKQHFVEFHSPGTLFAEITTLEIDSWDVKKAKQKVSRIKERYGAIPYGFRFITRGRGPKDLDSKIVKKSPMYYINCKIITLEEIEKRNDPKDKILLSNMRGNKWNKVVETIKGWRSVQPLMKDDVVL